MNKQEIKNEVYQSGFFFMLGIVVTLLLSSFFFKPQVIEHEVPTIVRDTIFTDSSKTAHVAKENAYVPLNDSTLKLELNKNGIKHSDIVLAQAQLETGHYTSTISKTHNNIFGMRKNHKYCRYAKWQDCVKDYKESIQSRYTGGSYYAFLERIGYAEDPNYTETLKQMV